MAVAPVVVVAAIALAGCYAPALRDCTVSCASPSDCARGQVCGDDGMCASPEVAGQCLAEPPDAAPGPDSGLPPDAVTDAAMPDSPALVGLRVQITGKGSVAIDGIGACSSQDPPHGDCMYDISPGVTQRARAIPTELDQVFAGWTSMTCARQGAICTFIPQAATIIVAKFEHH